MSSFLLKHAVSRRAAVYDGTIKCGSGPNAGHLVTGAGDVIQLRGANFPGLESTAAGGRSPDWNDQGIPDYPFYALSRPNVARIPINAASWLGLTCGLTGSHAITFTTTPASASTGGTLNATWALASGTFPINFNGNSAPYAVGTFTNGSTAVTWPALSAAAPGASAVAVTWASTRAADFNGTYQASVIAAVAAFQAIGCYVILDMHWTAPNVTIGGVTHPLMAEGQSVMNDTTVGLTAWQSIAATFGTNIGPQAGVNNFGIIFEHFNEPWMDVNGQGAVFSQGTTDLALLNGGTCSLIQNNNTQGGTNQTFATTWTICGHQAFVNAMRTAGAQNVLACGGNSFARLLQHASSFLPTDTVSPPQIAATWHPYSVNTYPYSDGNVWTYIGGDSGSGVGTLQWATACIAAGIPLMVTEDGGQGGTSCTSGEPHTTAMTNWADSVGASYVAWQHNNPQAFGTSSIANYLSCYQSDGSTKTYMLGYGQTWLNWMTTHG